MRVTVWTPEDEPGIIDQNCNKYIRNRWKDATKECEIIVDGRERGQGTGFEMVAYTSDPKKVGALALQLFNVASEGDTKVYSVRIVLYDGILSVEERYRQSMENVETTYTEWLRTLAEKFKDDSRVKPLAEGGKKVAVVISDTELLCEVESEQANKLIIEAMGVDLSHDKELLDVMIRSLIKKGLASKIIGYQLVDNTQDLKIEELRSSPDQVTVILV